VVLVAAGLTIWVTAAEVLPVKLASALYTAVVNRGRPADGLLGLI
jgi:hypothetical protein